MTLAEYAVATRGDHFAWWAETYCEQSVDVFAGKPLVLEQWQRDFFDFGHVQKLYLELMKAGTLSKGMQERIQRSLAGEKLPGYYPIGQAPVPIW